MSAITSTPATELAGLVMTGHRPVSPLHNEKFAGLLRTDEDHYTVFFNRCLGAQSGFGIRTLVLVRSWAGYGVDVHPVWKVETETFLPNPRPIVSRKGSSGPAAEGDRGYFNHGTPKRAVHRGDKR